MKINTNEDTIAAISTAMTDAGIGIIRISGSRAIEVADKYYVNKDKTHSLKGHKSSTIRFGYFLDDKGEIIDEVMVSLMKKPNSYTREDVVEINCHGGSMVMKEILELITEDEDICRLAEPGEFTKRAFLNGRIDLTGAEAVMDIIEARSEFALNNSEKQLRGAIKDKIDVMRKEILYEMAYIESALDDPENYDLTGYPERLSKILEKLIKGCAKLIDSSEEGRLRSKGISTVIVGKPNSGKSSLLNILTGEDTAIVTDIAGTTRDVIETDVKLGDLLLRVYDTAGIRQASDKIEAIGVERAKKYAAEADLVLYVIDSTTPLTLEDNEIFDIIKDKKIIILLNKADAADSDKVSKSDLESFISKNEADLNDIAVIRTSMTMQTGIEEIKDSISKLFFEGRLTPDSEVYVTNIRQKKLLIKTLNALRNTMNSVDMGMSEDFYAVDLKDAYESLGMILGLDVSEDLVNEIFSRFCMGK
ncbi:tRNA uridine-5-carboxymethylaminomethyl(34) synthesis GTPase MnmE [Butyrivibrio sp. MC2013]|uniref:tRNA uridine-5-carboxymethylaminomethyl(34) synthesis GTPase MnmE n=1 Tax=Butyrivibrio sp. MC2013 TaxID=1280686 RepID=UPI0003FB0431|nr:tRNA uridine-5-carboxymethylaminomethyl(34) synthesis GTPase MnmE [Butyrivibrio sp. MC2013]